MHEPVPLGRLVRHGGLAFVQACIRVALDVRPQSPWIPFDAAARLKAFLRNRSGARVLEYGSGMSTLWLARHASHVVSVESDPAWAGKVRALLKAHDLQRKVRLVYTTRPHDYVYVAGVAPGAVDLVVVDGDHRLDCGLHALRTCRPDGVIYVDDSDMRARSPEIMKLVEAVTSYASAAGGACETITDFSPTQAFPKQGLVAWLSSGTMTVPAR